MNNKAMNRLSAIAVISALLLCGCNNGGSDWDGNIDLVEDSSDNDIAPVTTSTTAATTTAAATTTTTTEAILTEPDRTIYEGVYATDENGVSSLDPVEFNLYYKDWETGESTLLYEHIKHRRAYYEDITYAVVDDGEQTPFMIAYSENESGLDLVTAYTAQYGELDILGYTDLIKDDEGGWHDISEIQGHFMMVIRDGDHILRSFCSDKEPQFEELFILENGIYDYDSPQSVYREADHFVFTASFANDHFIYLREGYMMEYTDELMMEYFGHTLDEFYICPDCGYGYEYFIWADKDGSWFWYHPESGVNEPIEVIGDFSYDVFIAKAE